ncbi:MAG: zinc ribbon domain-containing protein [Candidatus Poribacteria bacterium]
MYSQYLLSGLVFCGRCGYGMIGHTTRQYRYYMCANRSMRGKSVCPQPMIPQKKLETIIMEDIQNHLNNPIEVRRNTNKLLLQIIK